MTTQPLPPKALKELQYWFAGIISRPIDMDNKINPLTPSGKSIEEEAANYILPSPTLTPGQRMEIYNQQFYWRLLDILHETFPLLVRLFGYRDFNEKLGFPYISTHLPDHWSLNQLGKKLPRWIEQHYHYVDKELVYTAALMDYDYSDCFVAPQYSAITADQLEKVLEYPLFLQPNVKVYLFDYPFFDFREAMLKEEPEYWEENDFPSLPKETTGYILWRDCASNVGWIRLDVPEAAALKKFESGISFDALCDWLTEQPQWLADAATAHLQEWTHRWFVNEWLTSRKN